MSIFIKLVYKFSHNICTNYTLLTNPVVPSGLLLAFLKFNTYLELHTHLLHIGL
jgi:hypothetical protein